MKILLVSSQDYIHHPLPSRHHHIFEALAKKHEVHVVHFNLNNRYSTIRKTNLILHNCTLIPLSNPFSHYLLNAPYHFYKMDQIVKEGNFDIIVTGNILASSAVIRAGKKYGVPILFDLKDWFPTSAGAYLQWPLNKIVEKFVLTITLRNLKSSTYVSTVSDGLYHLLEDYKIPSRVITNGVDIKKFKSSPELNTDFIKEELGISKDDFIIGFSGSLEKWYDIKLLFKAGEDLLSKGKNHFKILIVGSSLFTSTSDDLEKYLEKSSIRDKVIFTGLVEYQDLPNFINCMDVGIIPLKPKHWRGIALPNKFFEYTACNKIIISSSLPSMRYYAKLNDYHNILTYCSLYHLCFYLRWLYTLKKYGRYPQFCKEHTNLSWDKRALEMEELLSSLY